MNSAEIELRKGLSDKIEATKKNEDSKKIVKNSQTIKPPHF